jgi:glycogen synthase
MPKKNSDSKSQVAFVTYETPFAPCGGVTAVMGRLPEYFQRAAGNPTVVITPFHYKIPQTAGLEPAMEVAGEVKVPFKNKKIGVEILKLERELTWYFLKAADQRFFAGERHPYDVGQTQVEIGDNLRRDAIFFGAATARSLPLIARRTPWVLFLQDWEAATAALALAEDLPQTGFRCFLTVHNSYDSSAPAAELLQFGIDPASCPGDTILTRTLPIVETPVFTVSDQFALDFAAETLQAEVMAPHLKLELIPKLVGINNGLFADLALDRQILAHARRGEFDELVEWKSLNRQKALRAMDEFIPSEGKPVWGDRSQFTRDGAPWFVLAGRDDSRQKGYDVASSAIRRFINSGGKARFLFFPIPGDEGLAGLKFLKNLAEQYPEDVIVLPFIFKEGYLSALRGATYAVMPSLYEPFGMANEFYVQGTVAIGRATGGILQQIIPLRAAASFSRAVQIRADHWYGAAAHPTGFLYRETDELPSAIEDWNAINAAGYDLISGRPDRVQEREGLALFSAMAEELFLAIEDAVRVVQREPELYYRMLVEGIDFIHNNFSWERTAHAYARYL